MTLSRLATVGLAAGLAACTPDEPVNPDAYAPYGFCRIQELNHYYYGGGDTPFSEEPSISFEDDPENPIDKKVLAALTERFEETAKEQIARVKEAGGYCNLPETSGPQPSTCMDEDFCFTPDTRLGDNLMIKVFGRNQWIADKHPDWNGHVRWKVNLGRSECAVVDNYTPEGLRQLDRFADEGSSFLTNAADRLNFVASNWNGICAEAQGGRFHGMLKNDKYAGAQTLVARGRVLKNLVTEGEFDELAQQWHERYVPNQDWAGKLSQEQEAYMLASGWFSKQVIGWDGLWDCPVDFDVNVADAGMRRHSMGGFVYECEADERREGNYMDGVIVPVPVY